MAKINVKLRPSGVEGKKGTIYYSVSHKSITRHISTEIRVLPEAWDGEKHRILAGGTDVRSDQNRIDCDKAALQRIVRDLELRRRVFSVDDILRRFRAPERYVSVLLFFQEQIHLLTDSNRLGTAMNYRRAARALSRFLGDRELYFSEFTIRFVEEYNDYLLCKGMVRNSRSFHMRILRAVYNKAVRCGFAEQTFPFRDVYTGIDRTRKRAIGEDVLSRLIRLDLGDQSRLSFSRDLFLFSFYTRGMAFVDIAYLRKTDIQDDVIRYSRHKTGHPLSVRVEPCIRTIIDRYSVPGSPYVFPILKSEERTASYRQYKTALRMHNYRLRELSRRLKLGYSFSSYTARHSWATTARNHNVPVSIISAGMGHVSERTTQIYLTTLENSLIDSANKGILDTFERTSFRPV